jgi:hypothetical protein
LAKHSKNARIFQLLGLAGVLHNQKLKVRTFMNQWQAWVNVKWKPGTPETAWQNWKDSKWVRGVWSTTGDWDCSIWLDVSTPDELENFVWKEVRGNNWVEATETRWAKQWWESRKSA